MTQKIPDSSASPCWQTDGAGIRLLTKEQYASLAKELPKGDVLLRGLSHIRYSKEENFSSCSQGLIHVPHKRLSFGFYFDARQLLLIDSGTSRELAGALERLAPNLPARSTPACLLLRLLELLIADDLPMLQQTEERLSKLEDELLRRTPEHFYETIIAFRKELSGYHSYYEQMGTLGEQLQQCLCLTMDEEQVRNWQLYINRTDRLHDHCERLREYLLQIRELYQSQIEVRQNKIMTFLTVVTTIFLPLTLIVGWYGMNFPDMFALRWRYGYPAVILISVGVVAAEIIYFHKKKML